MDPLVCFSRRQFRVLKSWAYLMASRKQFPIAPICCFSLRLLCLSHSRSGAEEKSHPLVVPWSLSTHCPPAGDRAGNKGNLGWEKPAGTLKPSSPWTASQKQAEWWRTVDRSQLLAAFRIKHISERCWKVG